MMIARKLCTALGMTAAVGLSLGALPAAYAAEDYQVGYITDLSGPLAGSYTPTWEGFELYMKSVNDNGGINGHAVDIVLDDDGLQAARALSNAKKQAQRDEVVGIFGLSLSSTQGAVVKEMDQEGVPVVSQFSGIIDALPPAKPYYYSVGVVFEVAGEVIGQLTPKIAPKGKVVGISFDSVGGRAALQHNKDSVEALGYQWDQVLFPVRTSDFTPIAQAVVAKNPDVVVGHYGSGQNLGIIPALRKAGYEGPYVVAVYGVTEDTVAAAAEKAGTGKNLYTVSRYASIFEGAQAVEDVKAAAAKYGTEKPLSTMHVHGWVLGKFAATALQKCGWPCSREQLNSVMSGLRIDTDGATGGPIEMTRDNHYGTSYWRLYKWDDGMKKLAPVGDWLEYGDIKYKN